MKANESDIISQAPGIIRSLFKSVPFVKIRNITVDQPNGPYRFDLFVQIQVNSTSYSFIVEVKSKGELKYVRGSINQLQEYIKANPSFIGVFFAPYISPPSAELCARSNISTIDLSGNCRIVFDRIYIERTGNPNKYAEKRDIRSLYSPKASRVIRVLLVNPKKKWKTQELADTSQVSLGQVANVKKLLADREWITESNDGMALANPDALLAEWSENYAYSKNEVHEYYSIRQPDEIEKDLAVFCTANNIPYALTGFSGAMRIAPSVRYQRVMSYVSVISDDLTERLQFKKVTSGANVSLLVPHDNGVYYGCSEKNNVRVVSPVQLYLDLKNYKGRGEEAADAILKQAIRTSW